MNNVITPDLISQGYAFNEYLNLIGDLVSKDQTTGNDQSAGMVEKSKLNLHRLKRIYKTAVVDPALVHLIEKIEEPLTWIMIVEAWCGDGAQIAPYFALVSELNPKIKFRLVLRDNNPELMDLFLTDGKKAIPKFICLDSNLNVVTTWGPRPGKAIDIFNAFKTNPHMSKDEFHKELHLWYSRDKGKAIMNEIYLLFLHCCENSHQELTI